MSKHLHDPDQDNLEQQSTTGASSGRIALCGFILLLLPLILYCFWSIPDESSVAVEIDEPAESVPRPVVSASREVDERLPVEKTRTDPVSVRAPGSTQESYVAPLADAYRRLDPTADGWQTEALHEAAGKQLKQLTRLFDQDLDTSILQQFVDDKFVCSALHSDSLRKVFQDNTLRVQRGAPLDKSSPSAKTFRGREGLREAVAELRQFYTDGKIERIKLKPFRIESNGNLATTTVDFQSVGATSEGRLQINAKWKLDWSTRSDDLPRLLAIRLDEYETVLHRGQEKRMFSDCTAAVLGDTIAYKQQFLRPTDYWRSRLSRNLGLDVVANHGIAIGDVNGDQLEDLYVCQQGGLPNRLFIQNSDGTLRDASDESGADWLDYCASALLVDFDNDGDRDLIVAQEWRILMMSNDGSGRFQLEFGTSNEAQSFSLSAADFDLDGDLDVYICGYNPTTSTLRRGVMGEPMPYHDANNGGQNILLRNDGNWLFTDVTSEVGLHQNNTRFSFAAAWEDYDNDGDPDLYVANDYGRNNFYQNNQGKFVDTAPDLDVEDMSAGMSASWADVNRDGRMDLYVSNMFSAAGNRITYQRQFKTGANANVREQFQRHARGNTLFLNQPNGFQDVSEPAAVTMGRWAWGSRFADLNGDGWEDLIVANGFISTEDTGDL
ncbi:MAG: VCBS repeat-containing protein [Planctomycetaceae bacterium]|nr:VCBS repeat-containing protein [Planctomycetaceae bacterium]